MKYEKHEGMVLHVCLLVHSDGEKRKVLSYKACHALSIWQPFNFFLKKRNYN